MKVGNLCSRQLACISAGDSLLHAARLMRDRQVGAIVVTAAPAGDSIPVGMLTDRDIVRAQLDRPVDLGQMRAADVMSRNPLELREDEAVDEAIRRMRSRGVRRAVVISPSGALAGVISFDDLLAHISLKLATLASLTRRRPQAAPRGSPDGPGSTI
jgi:CBS domain-containing protein